MPVCIKSEPRSNTSASQQPAQAPSTHTGTATNGSASLHRTQPTYNSQSIVSTMSRTSNSSQPSNTLANPSTKSNLHSTNGNLAEEEKAATISEDAIDSESVKGVFGWATLDDINVPYIFRKGKQFVAVRIVEKKVLNKYPNSFPDELGRKEPLVSYFVTEAEATLLNEINTIHCSFEYGYQPFTTKDLIVDLVEFEDFYRLVKKTFPENVLATITAEENKRSSGDERTPVLSKMCGWMQINNTVTPYIWRQMRKFVPLSVIQYAAQLLTKDQVDGHLPTPDECELLNETCKAAGFEFTFGKNTKLLHIDEVKDRCDVRITELPFDNPLQHAQYIDSLSQGEATSGQPAPLLAPVGIAGGMSLPYQSKPSLSVGPPNMNPFTPYNPFTSMMNMISQAPVSVSNHLLPRTTQLPSSVALPTGPQLSLVRTQTAPIFYPPAPSASLSSGMIQSQVNKTANPPAVATVPRPGSNPPQVHIVSPMGHPSLPPPLQAHGVPSAGQFPRVSSPGLARLPGYSGVPQARRPLSHPAITNPSAHHGTAALPFMASHQASQSEMVMQGIGQASRGAVPVASGFPSSVIPAGGLPPHMGIPQPYPSNQSQLQPPQSQRQLGVPAVPSQSRNSSLGHTGVLSHPDSAVPALKAPVFPVQLSPAAQSQGGPVKLSGVESVSRPPGVASNQTCAPDDHLKLVGDIKAEMFNGKSVSCMKRDSAERRGSFCLVEAVAKLYFPKLYNLHEFVNALQNVLGISLPVCTELEAKAFIHFYNLPVAKLNDNHMISLQDLKKYFPQISYMFRHSTMDPSNVTGQFLSSSMRRSTGSEGPTKLASPSAPITIVLNNNDSSEVISIDSGPPTPSAGSPGTRSSTKRSSEEAGVVGGKHSRTALDQRGVCRVDEVDGSVTAGRQTGNTTEPATTSAPVIVID